MRMPKYLRILFASITAISSVIFFDYVAKSFADDIHYESAGRRDPFIPLVGEHGEVSKGFDSKGMNVEGIVFDPNHGSLALINGEFYKQGDKVQNALVTGIHKDRVTLSQNDEEKTIWIREDVDENGDKNGVK